MAGTYRDISLDQVTGDVQVVAGDLVLTSGPDGIRQDVEAAWRQIRGEWFINDQDGIPYFGALGQAIIGKGVSLTAVRGLYRAAALACEGVTRVEADEVLLDFDRSARKLLISGTIHYDEGEVTAATSQELP